MKRLFFALETAAPWPDQMPSGRILDAAHRHTTLAFLGHTDWTKMEGLLSNIPQPNFPIGLAGIFDKLLLLPPRHPHVVAWHIEFSHQLNRIIDYQKKLAHWLISEGYNLEEREWLPHVTLARAPFNHKEWEETFSPLPMYISALHLYESIGNLQYLPLWSVPFPLAWKEIEHTADLAFEVYGHSMLDLYRHAHLALAWHFPPLIKYHLDSVPSSLDDVIMMLNEEITFTDQEIGCPFKAVSFHGEIQHEPERLLWVMIVDV